MRYRPQMIVALACAGIIAANTPSLARPSTPASEAAKHFKRDRANEQLQRARTLRDMSPGRPSHARLAPPARPSDSGRLTSVRATATTRPLFGWPSLVTEARKYVGTNPTRRSRLWCATFMNFVLAKTGYTGTGSDSAKSFASYGRRINEPRVGAIAVLTRGRNGGHVGVVTGLDAAGNPVIISGNHGRRVGEATYPRSRVIAYVMPAERSGGTQIASAAPANTARANDSAEERVTSPIAELLAAINAEKSQPSQPQHAQAAAAPARAMATLPRAVPPPQRARLVQQMPEALHAQPQANAQRQDMTLKQALSELLGVRRANAAEPRR